jgi:hypothetical protein
MKLPWVLYEEMLVAFFSSKQIKCESLLFQNLKKTYDRSWYSKSVETRAVLLLGDFDHLRLRRAVELHPARSRTTHKPRTVKNSDMPCPTELKVPGYLRCREPRTVMYGSTLHFTTVIAVERQGKPLLRA